MGNAESQHHSVVLDNKDLESFNKKKEEDDKYLKNLVDEIDESYLDPVLEKTQDNQNKYSFYSKNQSYNGNNDKSAKSIKSYNITEKSNDDNKSKSKTPLTKTTNNDISELNNKTLTDKYLKPTKEISKLSLKHPYTNYYIDKNDLNQSRSAYLELNLKELQEGKNNKAKRKINLEFDNLDWFVHEKDPKNSEIILDIEMNKIKEMMNKNFATLNSTITGLKNYTYPKHRLDTLKNIKNEFLSNSKEDKGGSPNRRTRFKTTTTADVLADDKFQANKNENENFINTVIWEEPFSKYNQFEILEEESKLIDQYKAEILDIQDENFVNKFSIIMHKYENVSISFKY